MSKPLLYFLLICSLSFNVYHMVQPFVSRTTPSISSNSIVPSLATILNQQQSQPDNTDISPLNSSTIQSTPSPTRTEIALQHQHNIEQLFNDHQFAEAVEQFELLNYIDELKAKRIKSLWLESAEAWIINGEFSTFEALYLAWSSRYPYDLEFILLQAQWLFLTDNIDESFYQLNYALSLTYTNDEAARVNRQIKDNAFYQLEKLKELENWPAVVELFSSLLEIMPEEPAFKLTLAEAQLALEQYAEAEQLLMTINHVEYNARVNRLLDDIANMYNEDTGIPLVRQGEHFVVTAIFNTQLSTKLLIDTGASLTVISTTFFEQYFNQKNTTFLGNSRMNTAGGIVEAPVYRIESLDIGGYTVTSLELVVMPFDDIEGVDGLLGMNYLKHFQFTIDQQNARLALSKANQQAR